MGNTAQGYWPRAIQLRCEHMAAGCEHMAPAAVPTGQQLGGDEWVRTACSQADQVVVPPPAT